MRGEQRCRLHVVQAVFTRKNDSEVSVILLFIHREPVFFAACRGLAFRRFQCPVSKVLSLVAGSVLADVAGTSWRGDVTDI